MRVETTMSQQRGLSCISSDSHARFDTDITDIFIVRVSKITIARAFVNDKGLMQRVASVIMIHRQIPVMGSFLENCVEVQCIELNCQASQRGELCLRR